VSIEVEGGVKYQLPALPRQTRIFEYCPLRKDRALARGARTLAKRARQRDYN